MTHRQPQLKDQAAILRKHFSAKDYQLSQGEALELASRLNGYPSYNVAKQACGASAKPVLDTNILEFKIWVGVHHHKHGQDNYFFTSPPSDADVIARVEEATGFDPEEESVEVLGVESFKIDVPLALAKATAADLPKPLVGIYELYMLDFLEYDAPETVPEWRWVQDLASFAHKGNGVSQGVWEFMVLVERLKDNLDDVPAILRGEVNRAIELDATWLLVHQG